MKKKFKGTKSQQKKLALDETALKYKINLPLKFKRRICKNCHSFLVPGKNLRVRTRKGHVVYYCLECKEFMRIGYK